MKDQQEAVSKKVTSQEIQKELEAQTVHITEKRECVMKELSQVEPAVLDAQQGLLSCLDMWWNIFSKSIYVQNISTFIK